MPTTITALIFCGGMSLRMRCRENLSHPIFLRSAGSRSRDVEDLGESPNGVLDECELSWRAAVVRKRPSSPRGGYCLAIFDEMPAICASDARVISGDVQMSASAWIRSAVSLP